MEKKFLVWNDVQYYDLEPRLNTPPKNPTEYAQGGVRPPEYQLYKVLSTGANLFTIIWKLV